MTKGLWCLSCHMKRPLWLRRCCVIHEKLVSEYIVLGENRNDRNADYTDDKPSTKQWRGHPHSLWPVSAATCHPIVVALTQREVSRRRTYQKSGRGLSDNPNTEGSSLTRQRESSQGAHFAAWMLEIFQPSPSYLWRKPQNPGCRAG